MIPGNSGYFGHLHEPCDRCNWMPKNCTCSSRPQREHPKRCRGCGHWRCTTECFVRRASMARVSRHAA